MNHKVTVLDWKKERTYINIVCLESNEDNKLTI